MTLYFTHDNLADPINIAQINVLFHKHKVPNEQYRGALNSPAGLPAGPS